MVVLFCRTNKVQFRRSMGLRWIRKPCRYMLLLKCENHKVKPKASPGEDVKKLHLGKGWASVNWSSHFVQVRWDWEVNTYKQLIWIYKMSFNRYKLATEQFVSLTVLQCNFFLFSLSQEIIQVSGHKVTKTLLEMRKGYMIQDVAVYDTFRRYMDQGWC
jgi:hypothetical protein